MAFIAAPIAAQTIITGTVMESGNMQPLSFVNIGIKQKNIGTVSTEAGRFTLSVPPVNYNDTLTFSMVGYDDCKLPIASANTGQQSIILTQSKHRLNEVTISTRKLKQHKYGLTGNPILHFTDGSIQQNDAFEIAQLINLGKGVSKITALHLHINEARKDSCTFRINFYSYEANRPGERVIHKSILQTHAIKPGWLQFDLRKYNIYLKGDVVAGIEFLPSENKNGPIVYEIKPGGRSKSFVRRSSLGAWQVPPHQYRMYVTTLSGDDMPLAEVQKDAMPDHELYSKYVHDTFSLFIRMPDGYARHKGDRYPVVYLLDANLYFDQVSESIGDMKGVQPILVGIGHNNFLEMDSLRNRDHTYPAALTADSFTVSGGADKFHDFVCKEL